MVFVEFPPAVLRRWNRSPLSHGAEEKYRCPHPLQKRSVNRQKYNRSRTSSFFSAPYLNRGIRNIYTFHYTHKHARNDAFITVLLFYGVPESAAYDSSVTGLVFFVVKTIFGYRTTDRRLKVSHVLHTRDPIDYAAETVLFSRTRRYGCGPLRAQCRTIRLKTVFFFFFLPTRCALVHELGETKDGKKPVPT